MSDNRLYLCCKACGTEIKIASLYYRAKAEKCVSPRELTEFLFKHGKCYGLSWFDEDGPIVGDWDENGKA